MIGLIWIAAATQGSACRIDKSLLRAWGFATAPDWVSACCHNGGLPQTLPLNSVLNAGSRPIALLKRHEMSVKCLCGWRFLNQRPVRGSASLLPTSPSAHVLRAEVAGRDGLPQIAEVTEDCLAVRIPLGPDDADNYIVGVCAGASHRAQALLSLSVFVFVSVSFCQFWSVFVFVSVSFGQFPSLSLSVLSVLVKYFSFRNGCLFLSARARLPHEAGNAVGLCPFEQVKGLP